MRAGRGFTFVELLVPVARLAVMAGLILPRLVAPAPDAALELTRLLTEGALRAQKEGETLFLRGEGTSAVLYGPAAEGQDRELGRYPLGRWTVAFVPERLLIFSDGSFSPSKVVLKRGEEGRSFNVTVTGQVLEVKGP